MSEFIIHRIEPFRVRDVAGAVGQIFREAHDYPDDETRAFINGAFAKHTTWPGFILLMATFEEIPVGFIYGYESRPGQWWHDLVRPAMAEAGHAAWQTDVYELAELAVHPAVQRRGVGASLIEAFLAEIPARKVLLTADREPANRARELYLRFGFVDLVPEFRYPGFDDLAVIMGREAPE